MLGRAYKICISKMRSNQARSLGWMKLFVLQYKLWQISPEDRKEDV